MSRHKVLGFYIQKDLKFETTDKRFSNNPYLQGYLHDCVDEYDMATRQQLVSVPQASAFSCDAVDMAYGAIQSPNGMRVAGYRFGEKFLIHFQGTTAEGFKLLGPDNRYQVIYFLKTPYPLDTDIPADRNIWSDQNALVEKIAKLLRTEYEEFHRQSDTKIVYVERPFLVNGANLSPFPNTPNPTQPYMVDMDHGQMEIDPTKPYFDASAGETGTWINPSAPPVGPSAYN